LVIQTAKPIQSQFKPILSQFFEKGKIDTRCVFTSSYEEKATIDQKTKPIKANSKHVLSGYILSKVEGVERANFRKTKEMLIDFNCQLFFRCSAGLPNSKAAQITWRAFSASSLSTAQLMRISLVVIESILILASAKAPNIFSATP